MRSARRLAPGFAFAVLLSGALACAPSGAPRSFEELQEKADRDLEACLRRSRGAAATDAATQDAVMNQCMRERDWVKVPSD